MAGLCASEDIVGCHNAEEQGGLHTAERVAERYGLKRMMDPRTAVRRADPQTMICVAGPVSDACDVDHHLNIRDLIDLGTAGVHAPGTFWTLTARIGCQCYFDDAIVALEAAMKTGNHNLLDR